MIFCGSSRTTALMREKTEKMNMKSGKQNKRKQFYSEYLIPFLGKISETYDSNIFKRNGLDSLKIKNEDFVAGI